VRALPGAGSRRHARAQGLAPVAHPERAARALHPRSLPAHLRVDARLGPGALRRHLREHCRQPRLAVIRAGIEPGTEPEFMIRPLVCLFLAAIAPAQAQDKLPLIKVLATGGTIANTPSGRLHAGEVAEAIPQLKKVARLDVEEVMRVGSSAITLE